jgi:hypothetical protein
MNTTPVRTARRARRWARGAGVSAGVTAALIVAAPTIAHAATANWSGALYPGAPRQCVGATGGSRARVEGTATAAGGRFVVLRDGVQLVDTGGTTNAYVATFSGAGYYQLCARNPQTASATIFASISVRTDRDAF